MKSSSFLWRDIILCSSVSIFLSKFHQRSEYIFRFEIFNEQKEKTKQVISELSRNSIDPLFLGYPYGLVIADEMARVSNNEAEYYRTKILANAGK